MLARKFRLSILDIWEDALEYDAIDFTDDNNTFLGRAFEIGPPSGLILDCGTGTARIPIFIIQRNPNFRIIAVDFFRNMLKIAEANVIDSGLQGYIELRFSELNKLQFPDSYFDFVISNRLIHRLPDPITFLKEVYRVVKPNGGIFIRDLIRPDTEIELTNLVEKYTVNYSDRQRKWFKDALCASFTIKEMENLVFTAGMRGGRVVQMSDLYLSVERKWHRELKKDFPLSKAES